MVSLRSHGNVTFDRTYYVEAKITNQKEKTNEQKPQNEVLRVEEKITIKLSVNVLYLCVRGARDVSCATLFSPHFFRSLLF